MSEVSFYVTIPFLLDYGRAFCSWLLLEKFMWLPNALTSDITKLLVVAVIDEDPFKFSLSRLSDALAVCTPDAFSLFFIDAVSFKAF